MSSVLKFLPLLLLAGCTTIPVTPSTFCTDYTRVTLTKEQWLALPDTAAQEILANERFYRDHCK